MMQLVIAACVARESTQQLADALHVALVAQQAAAPRWIMMHHRIAVYVRQDMADPFQEAPLITTARSASQVLTDLA